MDKMLDAGRPMLDGNVSGIGRLALSGEIV